MDTDDRLPSETLGHTPSGQIPFSDMLRLMDQFHRADKEIEKKVDAVEDRRRSLAGELHTKIGTVKDGLDESIDDLSERTTTLESDKQSLKERLDKLEVGSKDEFADIPFFLRPSYIKAMGLAIGAVILALAGAWYATKSRGALEEKPKKPEKPAIEAPVEPGDKPIGGLLGASTDAGP